MPAQLNRFQVSVTGRSGRPGYNEYVNATDVLEGKGRNADLAGPDTQYAKLDLYIVSSLQRPDPKCFPVSGSFVRTGYMMTKIELLNDNAA